METLNTNQAIPLSLYIHFPWCVKKCPYCDFNSHALKEPIPEDAYIDALIQDFNQSYAIDPRPIHSIFMGGGTPSLFKGPSIARLLQHIATKTKLPEEITLEANPGTIERGAFTSYRDAGITRISLGVQSFSNDSLHRLGRIHDNNHVQQAIAEIKAAGFTRWNIDLMWGLPNQSIEQALFDINQALLHEPPHLSWYQLTLEPNTAFYRTPPTLPGEDLLWDIHNEGHRILESAGLKSYEISAYSKNQASVHNTNYWSFGDYIGIGAGAHGKSTSNQHIERQVRWRSPKDYLDPDKAFMQKSFNIPPQELVFEFMLNTLRLKDGFHPSLFTHGTGLPLSTIDSQLKKAESLGLISFSTKKIQPTPKGFLYLNDLISLFLES